MLDASPSFANQTKTNLKSSSTHLAVSGQSIGDAYLRRASGDHDKPVMLIKKGEYVPISWFQLHEKVLGLSEAFDRLALKKTEKIAILSATQPEWHMCDVAAMSTGLVTVPIYPSSTCEDIAFILNDSDSKYLFVDDKTQLEKLPEVFKLLGRSVPLCTFSPEVGDILGLKAVSFAELTVLKGDKALAEKKFKEKVNHVKNQELASIVYTSGTTGKPKGVELSHLNFVGGISAVIREINFRAEDLTLTFLPFSHIFGRIESLLPVFCGLTLGFAENMSTVAQNMSEVKPTLLVSVPRIYEKIYDKMLAKLETEPPIKKKIFHWALDVGRQVVRLRSEKKSIPLVLNIRFQIADKLVFSKIRDRFGGRVRLTASGGAPLSRELCEIFHACGIMVMEGYGLTETLGPITVNRPDEYRFGTVGKPIGDAEVKIADDGEILLKGVMVFSGYYKNPQATAEVFTKDGWFKSGDIGEIDERGFLKITDRKKELIITSGGKNIAPQKLENLIKMNRFVSNCMVYGDQKKYLTVLITLNEEEVRSWVKTEGVESLDFGTLIQNEKLTKLIEEHLSEVNAKLANYESLKKFKILAKDFSVEEGELTPSLKLKRKIITAKNKALIDSMY